MRTTSWSGPTGSTPITATLSVLALLILGLAGLGSYGLAAGTRVEQHSAVGSRKLHVRYVVANPSSYVYLFPREPNALADRCPRYDECKYGLDGLNVYLRLIGPDAIRAAYAGKDVTVLLGS